MLPLTAMLAVVLGATADLTVLCVVLGATAAIVQGVGLVRWPFAVPELARRYLAAPDGPDGDATRRTVEVVFATLHRLLGVGIGEHLGYLFTGLWTLLVVRRSCPPACCRTGRASWRCPSGWRCSSAPSSSSGPNERDGWKLAGTIVPIAYVAWSIWLIVLGILLLV